MKERILDLLMSKEGQFVSGEEISKLLGMSRAGVWKHIKGLREEGYTIESQTKLGYHLDLNQIPFNKYELSRNLPTRYMGTNVVTFQEVTSTNDVAKEIARSGADHGTVVVSLRQTKGRGRMGRQWVSPDGGIWMSVVLRPQLELKDVARYTILAGVAVSTAINSLTGLQSGIKWPNDILINGKKVGGILTELSGEWQDVQFLIIGVGVNANFSPQELPTGDEATSLFAELGKKVDRVKLFQVILQEFERLEAGLNQGCFSEILGEWRALSVCLDCPVIVKAQNSEWYGHSLDIAPDGALLVKNQGGEIVSLYSGEVSLRTMKGNREFR